MKKYSVTLHPLMTPLSTADDISAQHDTYVNVALEGLPAFVELDHHLPTVDGDLYSVTLNSDSLELVYNACAGIVISTGGEVEFDTFAEFSKSATIDAHDMKAWDKHGDFALDFF